MFQEDPGTKYDKRIEYLKWKKFTICHINGKNAYSHVCQNTKVLYSSNRNLNMESRHLSFFAGDIIVLVN